MHVFDFKTRKDAVIAQEVDSYSLALNGQRVLLKRKSDYIVVDTKADAEKDADATKKLDLDRMRVLAVPIQEWSEMFDNAWRLERDFFFSPVMNGQDWPAVRAKYRALLPALGSRENLNYLIGQMLGEMGNSHTYVGGGDDADTTQAVHGALLGVDWALDAASGRYRIATIYPGDNTREAYRSPLSQPGLNVHAGDYLLAVNGVELRAPTDPDSLMQLADAETTVDLTVSDSPTGMRRRIVVRPIEKELGVREARGSLAIARPWTGCPAGGSATSICRTWSSSASTVRAAVLLPAAQTGPDHGRPLERRWVHRALYPRAPASHAGHAGG